MVEVPVVRNTESQHSHRCEQADHGSSSLDEGVILESIRGIHQPVLDGNRASRRSAQVGKYLRGPVCEKNRVHTGRDQSAASVDVGANGVDAETEASDPRLPGC